MNKIKVNYDKVLEILKTVTEKESFLKKIRAPKLKDIEFTRNL